MTSHTSFNKLEALYDISNALVSEHDLSTILNHIVSKIRGTGDYSIVSVYMLEGCSLHLKAKQGEFEHTIPCDHTVTMDSGIIGKAAQTRQAVIVNDIDQDPSYSNIFNLPIKSAIAVPLVKADELYGVFIASTKEENYFSEELSSFLKAVADTASIAIYNALTFNLLTATSRISSIISSHNDIIQVYPALIEELHKIIAFDGLIVTKPHFYRLKEMMVYPLYLKEVQTQIYESFLPLGSSATEEVIANKNTHVMNDINQSICYAEDRYVKSIEPQSVLRIPFQTLKTTVGVIHIYSQRSHCFGEREIKFFEEIIRLLSPTIYNVIGMNQTRSDSKLEKLAQKMNHELLATDNVEESMKKISRLYKKYMQLDRVFTWYIGEDGTHLYPVEDGTKLFPISFSDQHVLAQSLLMKRSQYVSNITDLSIIHESLRHIKAQSVIIIPLFDEIDQQLAGLMVATDQHNPHRFSIKSCEIMDQTIRTVGSHLQRTIRKHRLERNNLAMITALTIALDKKDSETEGHSERVVHYSVAIAEKMGLSEVMMKRIRWGALLHDIGKIGIPDAILKKPGKLNEEEWEVMRTHPVIGFEMISGISFLEEAIDIVLYHHEKVNGSGYPHGLKGEEIPLPARVFAIADAFDAITSKRPYKLALTTEEARAIILKDRGSHFCPLCVDAFLSIPVEQLEEIREQYIHKAIMRENVLV